MKIKEIISQHRRDFSAIFECEHCRDNKVIHGCYDDSYFHKKVIPNFKCDKCGKGGEIDEKK
mgnify:CR=1 FL=1